MNAPARGSQILIDVPGIAPTGRRKPLPTTEA
jgi:hypothetical protein